MEPKTKLKKVVKLNLHLHTFNLILTALSHNFLSHLNRPVYVGSTSVKLFHRDLILL